MYRELLKDLFLSSNPGVKGKAILRVDMNVPLRGGKPVRESFKFDVAARRIDEYTERGIIPIILTHQGRKGEADYLESLEDHAKVLERYLKKTDLYYLDGLTGREVEEAIKGLRDGEALLLKNVRSSDEEKKEFSSLEEVKESKLAELVDLADLYINDAPATMHRDHFSLTKYPLLFPKNSYLGYQFEEELRDLEELLGFLEKGENVAIVFGGRKWEKLNYIKKILRYENVKAFIGGIPGISLAYVRRKKMGRKNFRLIEKTIQDSKTLYMQFKEKIVFPCDFKLEDGEEIDISELGKEEGLIMDIGTKTFELYSEKLGEFPVVIFAGPLGAYDQGFKRTVGIIVAVMLNGSKIFILGGHSSDILKDTYIEKVLPKVEGVMFTGGGSHLAFLAGERLPVIETYLNLGKGSEDISS